MEWRLYFIGVRVEIDEGKKDIDTILQEVHKDLSDYLNTFDNSDYAKCEGCSFSSSMLHCGYCLRNEEAREEYAEYQDFYEKL